MTDTAAQTPRRLARSAAMLLAAASLPLGLAACGEDSGSAAVRNADIQFGSIGGGTGPAVDAQWADKVYSEVAGSLGSIAGSSGGVGDAAAVLLSAANLGTAATMTDLALDIDQALRADAGILSSELTQWTVIHAQVQAAEAIDTRAEADEVSRALRAKQAEKEAFEAANADIQSRLADLQAQIDDLSARAAAARERGAQAELQMNRAPTATEAAAIAPRVRDALLEADRLSVEAERVRAVYNALRPEGREAQLNVEMIRTQMDLLVRSRDEAVARQRAAEADADTARAAGAPVASRLAASARSLAERRAGDYDQAFDAALRELRSAVESARKATGPAKNSGQAAAAVAQQGIAELQRRRADTLLGLANLFESIAAARVPGADIASIAAETREAAQSAHEASSQAFAAAASAYRGINVQGEARQRLQETAELLTRYAEASLGQPVDFSPRASEEEIPAEDAAVGSTEDMPADDAGFFSDESSDAPADADTPADEDAQP